MKKKEKKCCVCGDGFVPYKTTDKVCGSYCGFEMKKQREVIKKQRSENRIKEERESLMRSAVTICHSYIRMRDRGNDCISCGKKWDKTHQAGHMFSSGGHSAVMFDETNINSQCRECNSSGSFSMNAYITGFKEKYSEEQFEDLKHFAKKIKRWESEELREVISTYREKIKKIKNE